MTKNSDWVHKNWRWSMLALKLVLAIAAVVTGVNIWDSASQGRPFNWIELAAGLGFFAFAGLLYIFLRLIFKLVMAKALHDERKK